MINSLKKFQLTKSSHLKNICAYYSAIQILTAWIKAIYVKNFELTDINVKCLFLNICRTSIKSRIKGKKEIKGDFIGCKE